MEAEIFQYSYRARVNPQEVVEGLIHASTDIDAAEKLLGKGLHPISIARKTEERKGVLHFHFVHRVSAWDLAQFTRQLSDLLGAGLTLYNALLTIVEQVENKRLKEISLDLSQQIRSGKSFADSLETYSKVFSSLFVNMVRIGERSGALEEVLDNLASFSEREDEIRKKVRNAMAYPSLMAFVGFITVVVLTVFVIPQLVGMFEELNQVLPLPTRILIGTSRFLISYGWIGIMALVLGALWISRQGMDSKRRIFLDRVKLRIPVVGNMLRKVELSRFGRGLGILSKNGVPIIKSLDVMAGTLKNHLYRNEVKTIKDSVARGDRLGTCLKHSSFFGAFVANTISVGEESGTLDRSLYKISDTFDREIDQSVRLITSLLEPIMILVFGTIIGFIVISMMLPIFEIDMILK